MFSFYFSLVTRSLNMSLVPQCECKFSSVTQMACSWLYRNCILLINNLKKLKMLLNTWTKIWFETTLKYMYFALYLSFGEDTS